MGHVFTEVTLKNAIDMGFARNGYIKEEEIRAITVNALVDTGATMLFISEETCEKLGLRIVGSTPIHIANGTVVSCQVTEPVELVWRNRFFTCNPSIMPGAEVTLMGVIPLEAMDLKVNPTTLELEGAHGDEWVSLAM